MIVKNLKLKPKVIIRRIGLKDRVNRNLSDEEYAYLCNNVDKTIPVGSLSYLNDGTLFAITLAIPNLAVGAKQDDKTCAVLFYDSEIDAEIMYEK